MHLPLNDRPISLLSLNLAWSGLRYRGFAKPQPTYLSRKSVLFKSVRSIYLKLSILYHLLKNFASISWTYMSWRGQELRKHVKWRGLAVNYCCKALHLKFCAVLDYALDMWWYLALIGGQVRSCNIFIYSMLQCFFLYFDLVI